MSNYSQNRAEVRLVPVFPKRGDTPSTWVQPAVAQAMLECGAADRFRWRGFAKLAVRMTEERKPGDGIQIRGESCRITESVVMRYVTGEQLAVLAVNAWA